MNYPVPCRSRAAALCKGQALLGLPRVDWKPLLGLLLAVAFCWAGAPTAEAQGDWEYTVRPGDTLVTERGSLRFADAAVPAVQELIGEDVTAAVDVHSHQGGL